MNKDQLIRNVLDERRRWDIMMENIDFSNGNLPVDAQEVKLRDLLHHVAWYEAEMVGLLKMRILAGSEWWGLPTDERNERIREEGQTITIQEACQGEQRIFEKLLGLLQQLSDEEVEEARFFQDMPADWKPWEVLAENTYKHFQQHVGELR